MSGTIDGIDGGGSCQQGIKGNLAGTYCFAKGGVEVIGYRDGEKSGCGWGKRSPLRGSELWIYIVPRNRGKQLKGLERVLHRVILQHPFNKRPLLHYCPCIHAWLCALPAWTPRCAVAAVSSSQQGDKEGMV